MDRNLNYKTEKTCCSGDTHQRKTIQYKSSSIVHIKFCSIKDF